MKCVALTKDLFTYDITFVINVFTIIDLLLKKISILHVYVIEQILIRSHYIASSMGVEEGPRDRAGYCGRLLSRL